VDMIGGVGEQVTDNSFAQLDTEDLVGELNGQRGYLRVSECEAFGERLEEVHSILRQAKASLERAVGSGLHGVAVSSKASTENFHASIPVGKG